MKVKWLRTAIKNLDYEAEYIAQENPEAARKTAEQIVNSVNLLADNPSLGHVGRINGTRELVVPNTRYIVPYRVRVRFDTIEILRVFHSSRRLPTRW